MSSTLSSLAQLEQQRADLEAKLPGDIASLGERRAELGKRIAEGNAKIETARLRQADGEKVRAAQKRLDELMAELREVAALEQQWYALDRTISLLLEFRGMPCVPGNARMALVLPGVIELKVRLDGTDDVPF